MNKVLCSLTSIFFCLFPPVTDAGGGYYPVSLMQLVVEPEKYLNQKVRVKGYFEYTIITAIYPNHLSAEIRDIPSAIEVLDMTENGDMSVSCNETYVVLSGRFVEHETHYQIKDVDQVLDVKSLKACWSRKD